MEEARIWRSKVEECLCKNLLTIGMILSSLAKPSYSQGFIFTHKAHTLWVKDLIPIRLAPPAVIWNYWLTLMAHTHPQKRTVLGYDIICKNLLTIGMILFFLARPSHLQGYVSTHTLREKYHANYKWVLTYVSKTRTILLWDYGWEQNHERGWAMPQDNITPIVSGSLQMVLETRMALIWGCMWGICNIRSQRIQKEKNFC